LSLIIV